MPYDDFASAPARRVQIAGSQAGSATQLGLPGVSRVLTSGAASSSVALTAAITRVSLKQRNADARFVVGTGAQTATATSHFIEAGERMDIQVPAGATIAVIRDGAADGFLQISELL